MCTKEVELRDPAHRVTIIDAGRKRGERGGRRAAGEREDYADESTGVTSFGMYFPLRFELRGINLLNQFLHFVVIIKLN